MYTLPSNGRDGADRGRINTALALQPSSRDYTDHGNLSWLEEGLYHGFMVFHLSEGVGKDFLIGTLSVQDLSYTIHSALYNEYLFVIREQPQRTPSSEANSHSPAQGPMGAPFTKVRILDAV